MSVGLVLRGILLRVIRLKTLFHAGVIDAEELVLRRSRGVELGLALGAFLIEELVYRLTCRSFPQISTDNLV